MVNGFNGMFLAGPLSCTHKKERQSFNSLPTTKAFRLRHQVNVDLIKSNSAQELNWKVGTKNWESSTKIETTHLKSIGPSLAWQSSDRKSNSRSPLRKLSPYMQPILSKGRIRNPIEFNLKPPLYKTVSSFDPAQVLLESIDH